MSLQIILAYCLAFGGACVSGPTNQAEKRNLVLTPCEVNGVTAKCGEYEVFENRSTKMGRTIKLKVLLYPATGPDPLPDPFMYIPGGPGSSATEDAPYLIEGFARIRERRDLLFVDQRGTGHSNPLNCQLFDPSNLQSYLGYFFPLEDVRKCRTELDKKADLTLYTTSIGMDDYDEVRAALGYDKLNLMGASYGTRAAMVYLRQHPKHVRTITLYGVAPTNQFMPRTFAQDTERALQGVLSECVADAACNQAYPNIRDDAKNVLAKLLNDPVSVEVTLKKNGLSTAPAKVSLSRNLAAEALRYMLYQPSAARRIPFVIYRAAKGDFAPLAEAAVNYRQQIVATGSNGMYLSVTCAEDLPFVKAGEAEEFAKNTFLGDYRFKQQREACELWPRGSISQNYAEPTKSDVPVLIFTGQWDPVTPPSNGDYVAKSFSNSLHLVVPQGGHGFGGMQGAECVGRLQAEFVEKADVKALETSCIKSIKRQPWILAK